KRTQESLGGNRSGGGTSPSRRRPPRANPPPLARNEPDETLGTVGRVSGRRYTGGCLPERTHRRRRGTNPMAPWGGWARKRVDHPRGAASPNEPNTRFEGLRPETVTGLWRRVFRAEPTAL